MYKRNVHKFSTFISDVFYAQLKDARARRGLSQKELALRSGLKISTVQRLESGMRPPAITSLRALSDALEISADYLLGRCEWDDTRYVRSVKAQADSKIDAEVG